MTQKFDAAIRQGFTNAVLDTKNNRQGTKYAHVGSEWIIKHVRFSNNRTKCNNREPKFR